MDETQATPVVGAFVPIEITYAAGLVAECLTGSVYLSGGSLLSHETQDYDFLVLTQMSVNDILENLKQLCARTEGMQEGMIMKSYSGQTASWRMIAKVTYMGNAIDILVMPTNYSVDDIMAEYPLSIQKQALWLAGQNLYDTNKVYHKDFIPESANIIIVHKAGHAMEKYQKYYPNHSFLLLPGSWETV